MDENPWLTLRRWLTGRASLDYPFATRRTRRRVVALRGAVDEFHLCTLNWPDLTCAIAHLPGCRPHQPTNERTGIRAVL
jgi:hypothetical protein